MAAQTLEPLTLQGAHVRLEPLSEDHLDALWQVACDPSLWRWTVSQVDSRDSLAAYIRTALQEAAAGQALPFATCLAADGRVVGSTRFGAFVAAHERVEIGWTFVGRAWQRTRVNSEAKLLMLTHAFETLGLRRVELKTDVLNEPSRRAMRRLGAVEEGTLRSHALCDSGRIRDTIYYSILREEWPDVRAGMRARLGSSAS